MKIEQSVIRTWIGCAALFLSAFPLPPVQAAPYVLDAGHRLARHGELYWLDNERVLFYGGTAKQGSRPENSANARGTYIWDLRNGKLEHVSEWEITCFHPDYSTWSLLNAESGQRRFKAGKFGEETEYSLEAHRSQNVGGRVRNAFTCKTQSRAELSPPAPPGRRIIVLRDSDGYLAFGPETSFKSTPQTEPILFYRPGSLKPIQLPLLVKERLSLPSYSEFAEAYVLIPSQDKNRPNTSDPTWPIDRSQPVYEVKQDGQVRTTIVPAGEWHDVHYPAPTRAGLIFSGGNFYRNLGLWILKEGSVRRLMAGYVHALKVSPNGCKAVLGIQTKHLDMGTPIHLKVVDFCVTRR